MAENCYKVDEDEERRIIIDKYEKGRAKVLEEGNLVSYEDPDNEIYHVVDRYGFVHDYKLPEKLSKYENQLRELEAKRRDKWHKMIKNWSTYKIKNYDKLRERVFKGIPNAVRGNAWLLLLDVPRIKEEQTNRYEEMYDLGKRFSKEVRQIDLDINRTFRNNLIFRERYNTKQQELFRVLVAYSVYNSEIGYCQGMSQIAALLLMFTTEEDAFWALDRLMSGEKYAMHGFFVPGFPKLQRFARHHDLVLKKFLNKVYKHFRKLDVESTLYTLKWFFQCFLDRVPFSLTLRLWDCFMVDGERILTCMSYTLLKLHKRTILKKGMDDLIPFLQIDLEKDFGYHDDEAISELQRSIQDLHKHKMDVPQEAASELEKPSRPFGFISQQEDTCSIINDDRSIIESVTGNCKPFSDKDEDASIANTSRTSSNMDADDYKEDIIDDDLNGDICKIRKLSVYDNVDLNESFEAAKRLADEKQINNYHDANFKQLNTELNEEQTLNNQIIGSNEAINQTTKQLDSQSEYTQEIFSKRLNESSNDDNTQFSNSDIKDNHYDILVRQTKTTSSFKDKFLRRKSSIPMIKRTESKRISKENNKSEGDNQLNDQQEAGQINYKNGQKDNHKNEQNNVKLNRLELIRSLSFNKTPNKSALSSKPSLIPRLNSPSNQVNNILTKNNKSTIKDDELTSPKLIKSTSPTPIKSTLKDDELTSPSLIKSAIKSNIPLNNSIVKTTLASSLSISSNDDQTSKGIKIYVPYAEIKSKNNSRANSKNSLASSTNSINLNGTNGLKLINKRDDLNKITINVYQKYSPNNDSVNKNMKSYLPKIDT